MPSRIRVFFKSYKFTYSEQSENKGNLFGPLELVQIVVRLVVVRIYTFSPDRRPVMPAARCRPNPLTI